MSDKKINYLARTFDDYRSELIKFSNKYYPELADSYNDSSVGSWFLDIVAAVSDNLSYHIDRNFNEVSINSANMKSSVMNLARVNGLNVPGPKASVCEIELSCEIPIGYTEAGSISEPDWNFAPVVKRATVVSAGNLNFQLNEDVNFAEQFNSDGYSNRKYVPRRTANGIVSGYTVSKSTLAVNGSTRIFKKVIRNADLKPFMEVILPEKNVMCVESIIFKETSNYNTDPDISTFYIEKEIYKVDRDAVLTYRYFEVDSLAEQHKFASVMVNSNEDSLIVKDYFNPTAYDDYTETAKDGTTRTTRYYRGKWQPIKQKYITEYTDNGYLKIIFGAGNGYEEEPNTETKFSERFMSNLINNDMLGVLPREGWTMFVLYRVGGGISSNVGVGAINSITLSVTEFKSTSGEGDEAIRGKVLRSLSVTNTSPAVAGKDMPSTDEIKYLIKYNNGAQERCVTVKDYKARLMMMPPKFGAPFRASVVEENNKIVTSMLGLSASGNLTKALPQTLVDNVMEYMSHYRTIGDYLEFKSGRIYNLGFLIELFVSKTYDVPTVVDNVISTVKNYMDVNKHDMGENIFVGDLEKEVTSTDGVISIISFEVYSIYDGEYSSDRCPLPEYGTDGSNSCNNGFVSDFKVDSSANSFRIDLDGCEHVLYSDYNSMYEILNDSNIQVKVKLI